MKTKLLALLLLAGGSLMAGTHFSFGIGVGPSYGYGYRPYYAPHYYAPAYNYYEPTYYEPSYSYYEPSYSYYEPAPVVEYRPVYPGPGYNWVSGYWYHSGPRRLYRRGYWSRGYGRGW